MKLPLSKINQLQQELENHPLLNGGIKNIDSLHVFMEHHVFAVWDFMSLLKTLQNHVCPSTKCWLPTKNIRSGAARLINEIVLSEESDIDLDGVNSISHHDLYCQAMLEVGADANLIEEWTEAVENMGVYDAFETCSVPPASLEFMRKTFDFIGSDEAHIVAGAFCFGRETIIPKMFSRLASELDITKIDCPKFHYYLERHVQIDGEEHGPASIALVENLCDHDPVHLHEAEQAAIESLKARIKLWDAVQYIIDNELDQWRHS